MYLIEGKIALSGASAIEVLEVIGADPAANEITTQALRLGVVALKRCRILDFERVKQDMRDRDEYKRIMAEFDGEVVS